MDLLSNLFGILVSYFFTTTGNWGCAIFFLAFAIRVVLFPVQIFQARQQMLMLKIRPRMTELSQQLKEDPLGLYRATSELKRQNGVRGGLNLLAAVAQIPTFLSVYRMFSTMQNLLAGSFGWMPVLSFGFMVTMPAGLVAY